LPPAAVLEPSSLFKLFSMLRHRPILPGFLKAAGLLLAVTVSAQEVRRAEPVNQDNSQNNIPTARAVPFEPFESPTPAQAPAATPVPQTPPDNTSPDTNPPQEPAPPPPAPESADQVQLDYANGFYSRGEVDLAAPEYEKYLSLYPDAPMLDRESALFRVGECYRRIGNVNAAKNAYQTLLLNYAIGQFIGPAAYRLGDMYYEAKDYEGALDYFRKASVRVTDPTVQLAAKFYSARCLEAEGLPSEARMTYEDIVGTQGDNPYRESSRLSLAEILSASGRRDEALAQFEALGKEATQPSIKAEAYVKAGLLNIDLGHPEKGAVDLNQALATPEIGPLKPVAEIGLVRVLFASGKFQEVLNQYQAALADVPDDMKPEVLLLAANAKSQLNDYSGASDLYQQIIKTYPTSASADEARYKNLVSIYNAGDPNVIGDIDQFLTANPQAPERDQITLMKAEALMKEKKYGDAAPVYAAVQDSTLAVALRADALFKEGWCYMQINQGDKAIEALTGFLQTYPLSKLVPTALAQRALAYQMTKDLTSALKDYNQLLSDYPKTKERELALQQKGLILGEQQDNDGMSAAFQQLLQEYPHSSAAAEANYWIGYAAFSAKDYKACVAPLEAARKLDKAQFFERATLRIILADYTLGDRDSLASEVDLYNGSHPKDKVQPDVLRSLGQSYLDANDFANAGKYLNQLCARSEATPDDWLNLGSAQLGAKQYPDAIDSVNKYLAAQSDPAAQARGLLVLGQAQLDAGKLDEAQASADKACSLEPEGLVNGQGRMLSGDVQVARSNFDAAAKIFQSIAVILDDPKLTPVAMEKAYECLNQEGNTSEAAKVLNELQTKYPEYQLKTGNLAPP
jgi:tetratricopeptide (TPR) repeat protein